MKQLELFNYKHWKPLENFGFKHNFFTVHSETVSCAWVAIGIILILAIIGRYFLYKKKGIGHFLVVSFGESFVDLCDQILGNFSSGHFSFVTSIFCFILICNTVSIIPWLEEPTKDINTTLALGLVAFAYVHMNAIRTHGLWAYTKEYFSPFILMFPLNVVGKLANVISISFRLFGNIFGGGIIAQIYHSSIDGSIVLESIGIITGLNIIITLFFVLFEGFIQAFVFSMLTLTYLSIAIQKEENEEGN